MGALDEHFQGSSVVDVDVHLDEWLHNIEAVAPYVDEPYRTYFECNNPFSTDSRDRYMGGKVESIRATDPSVIQTQLCEDFGVDHPIINQFRSPDEVANRDLGAALMRGFNNMLLDRYLDDNEDFYGLASIDTREPEAAAEEIDRLGGEDQIVGVYFGTTATDYTAGDPKYDVIYRAASDNDMPVAFHATNFTIGFPKYSHNIQTYLEQHTIFHLWPQSMTVASLIANGTVEKFPDLEFAVLESGIAWIPYIMFRLNKEYSMRKQEAPLLECAPEEYIRDRFYFGTQPLGEPASPDHLKQLVDIIGVDRLMLATDFPHHDYDHPSALAGFLNAYSDEDADRLLRGTATEVFGL